VKKPFKVYPFIVKNRKKIACLKTFTVSKNKYYLYFTALIIFNFFLNYKRLYFNTFNLEWFFIELINSYNTENYYFNYDLFQNNQALSKNR